MNDKDYLRKAKRLARSNFRMYGLGNFDIYVEDMVAILKLLDDPKGNAKLELLYERLRIYHGMD